ncbi:hypothetical protein [Henriciella aquimarina]|uniref:hypothetical protein n=1 Tax=Henriciella aquimarina TaxID=545261 RepID=UPI0009FE9085|nr:hypothetical protein [Henriciella aquimarina]
MKTIALKSVLSTGVALPLLLSVISLAGLIAALLIDGWPDALAALAAGAGLLGLGWALVANS